MRALSSTKPPTRLSRFFARKLPRAQVYLSPAAVMLESLRHLPAAPARGHLVAELERAFRAELEVEHAYLLPHARICLHYLLKALELPANSEVLMTPVTIPDVVNVVLLAGLRPVFVDLGERTANVSCDDLERKVTPRTRLLLLTHLCGLPSDMERVMAFAARHGIDVLEDCSQVMGARYRGRPMGTFGRAGFFSLSTLKQVASFQGGLLVTNDAALDARVRELSAGLPPPKRRAFGPLLLRDYLLFALTHPLPFSAATYHVMRALEAARPDLVREFQRGNVLLSRARWKRIARRTQLPRRFFTQYTDYQAALALRSLRSLGEGNARRRELSLQLLSLLEERGVPGTVRIEPGALPIFWRFPIWVAEPARFRAFLRERFLDSSLTNLDCCSREDAFAGHLAAAPNAERMVDHAVFLPMHPTATEADMLRIAEAVADYFADGGS